MCESGVLSERNLGCLLHVHNPEDPIEASMDIHTRPRHVAQRFKSHIFWGAQALQGKRASLLYLMQGIENHKTCSKT